MSKLDKLHQLLAREPNDVFLNFGLAMELARLGRRDEAIAQFDHVLSLDPRYLTAYFQKANTLVADDRVEQAKAVLQQGIEAAMSAGDQHAADEMRGVLDTL